MFHVFFEKYAKECKFSTETVRNKMHIVFDLCKLCLLGSRANCGKF